MTAFLVSHRLCELCGKAFRTMQRIRRLALIAPLLVVTQLAAQSRPLTCSQVAEAIQKSLAANGFSTAQPLLAHDISFEARVLVTEDHPNLTVTRFESRAGSATTHVALWIASEPRIPPFWVTLNQIVSSDHHQSVAQAKQNAPLSINPRETEVHYVVHDAMQMNRPPRGSNTTQPPLVHAGKPIQLVVQGSGMRITAKATALETGREGQQIRVKCQPAGKVLVAKIISAETAEIDY